MLKESRKIFHKELLEEFKSNFLTFIFKSFQRKSCRICCRNPQRNNWRHFTGPFSKGLVNEFPKLVPKELPKKILQELQKSFSKKFRNKPERCLPEKFITIAEIIDKRNRWIPSVGNFPSDDLRMPQRNCKRNSEDLWCRYSQRIYRKYAWKKCLGDATGIADKKVQHNREEIPKIFTELIKKVVTDGILKGIAG